MKKIETILIYKSDSKITLVFDKEFKKVCPNYNDISAKILLEKHNLFEYLHNEKGPAVIDHKRKPLLKTYMLRGYSYTKYEWEEKIKRITND